MLQCPVPPSFARMQPVSSSGRRQRTRLVPSRLSLRLPFQALRSLARFPRPRTLLLSRLRQHQVERETCLFRSHRSTRLAGLWSLRFAAAGPFDVPASLTADFAPYPSHSTMPALRTTATVKAIGATAGPAPPSGPFKGEGTGNDGYNIYFHPDGLRVFNYPHFDSAYKLNCLVSNRFGYLDCSRIKTSQASSGLVRCCKPASSALMVSRMPLVEQRRLIFG